MRTGIMNEIDELINYLKVCETDKEDFIQLTTNEINLIADALEYYKEVQNIG